MKQFYYLGTPDIPERNFQRIVLCDPYDIAPRQLPVKDMRTKDFEAAIISGKIDLRHCFIQKKIYPGMVIGKNGLEYGELPNVHYYGVNLYYSYRSAHFMVISHVTLEGAEVGSSVIDNQGRLRLFAATVLNAGVPHNDTDDKLYRGGAFYIRHGGATNKV